MSYKHIERKAIAKGYCNSFIAGGILRTRLNSRIFSSRNSCHANLALLSTLPLTFLQEWEVYDIPYFIYRFLTNVNSNLPICTYYKGFLRNGMFKTK